MSAGQLYTFWRSSASYRVRIALNLKTLEYEAIPIHFRKDGGQHRSPDFLLTNPQGLLPVWAEGGWSLNQSLAIIEYLDELYPDVPLLPSDRRHRAEVRALAQEIACDIHPLDNLRVLAYLRQELNIDQNSVDAWYRHWVEVGFEAFESRLVDTAGRFSYGDAPGLVDCCLMPQIYNARRFDVDMSPYPTILRIEKALSKLEAFVEASPEQQPDAEISPS